MPVAIEHPERMPFEQKAFRFIFNISPIICAATGTIFNSIPQSSSLMVPLHDDDADGCPVCGWRRARWRQWFCSDCHAVIIGSSIKLKPRTLVFRHLTGYYSTVWAIARLAWHLPHDMWGLRTWHIHVDVESVLEWDIACRSGTDKSSIPYIELRKAHRSVLGTDVAGKLTKDPCPCWSVHKINLNEVNM